MFKKALVIAVLLSLVGLFGCTSADTGTTESPASVNVVRKAQIASGWALQQMEIRLDTETPIMLTLASGDKVDGYFYCISGANITFSISGNSLIYESGKQAPGVASDRFSFTASQAQGIAYTLKLAPLGGGSGKIGTNVFLEIIYPSSGKIFVPIGTE